MGFNSKLSFAIAVSLLLSWQLADTVSSERDDVAADGTANGSEKPSDNYYNELQDKANKNILYAQLSQRKPYTKRLPLAGNIFNVGVKLLGENLRRDNKKGGWILMPRPGPFTINEIMKITLKPDEKILNTNVLVSNTNQYHKSDDPEPNTDVDDDVSLITIKEYSSDNRVFYPVRKIWQRSKCMSLNLKLTKININVINPKVLSIPSDIKNIVGDGNCLYRALSYWITGREDDHLSIRQLVCKIVKSNNKIAKYIGGKDTLRTYLKKNPIENYGVWGSDVEIFGAAILLNTPIYVYVTISNEWQLFNTDISFKKPLSTTKKCLYIRNINNIHYDVVINVQ